MTWPARRRVLVVLGTRPEAIKLAPVVLALQRSGDLEPVVVVTGQHREMLNQVLDAFGIVPDHDLQVLRHRQSLCEMTACILERLSPIVAETDSDAALIQGDTTTTFAGALAAFYHRVPVVHLEAGLRTGNALSPYPEEVNRRLTTQLATLHLAPTPSAKANLVAQQVAEERIVVTGNTVIDALLWTIDNSADAIDPGLNLSWGRRMILVTAHRRESWGRPMEAIGRALRTIALTEPDTEIVFPLHRNPLVREAVIPHLSGLANVQLLEPLAYDAFTRLMGRSHVILTDSGGIQEEAPSLGTPVLVMRDTTERPEAVAAGTARLVGTAEDAITTAVRTLLHDEKAYVAMANATNPYGDGHATRRTIGALRHFFGTGPRPVDFDPSARTVGRAPPCDRGRPRVGAKR